MDAGGLAQMTYNNFQSNNVPSFGPRGRASHLRNLSSADNLAAPAQEQQQASAPRSERAKLVTGLRASAQRRAASPARQRDNGAQNGMNGMSGMNGYQNYQPEQQWYSNEQVEYGMPQHQLQQQQDFNALFNNMSVGQQQQIYDYMEQQRQQQKILELQQQLAELQMEQAKVSGINNTSTPPRSPNVFDVNAYNDQQFYQQQYQQQFQASSPQQQHQQQPSLSLFTQQPMPSAVEISPPTPQDTFAAELPSFAGNRANRSRSPPKLNLSVGGTPGAFRRGHRKASSLSTCTTINNLDLPEPPKTGIPKNFQGFPETPTTSSFAPGHASGLHPSRQPRNPPSIEELKRETPNQDGNKNFATRKRRAAFEAASKIVAAGKQRRSNRSSSGSNRGMMTPVSEHDGFGFDEFETASASSGTTGRLSRNSLRDFDSFGQPGDAVPSVTSNKLLNVVSAAEKRRSALF